MDIDTVDVTFDILETIECHKSPNRLLQPPCLFGYSKKVFTLLFMPHFFVTLGSQRDEFCSHSARVVDEILHKFSFCPFCKHSKLMLYDMLLYLIV